MNKRTRLNSKNKPLSIVAWAFFFLMVLSSDGAETISAECLTWDANDSVPVSSVEDCEKIDFANYTFDPKAVDVAEGAAWSLSKGSNETGLFDFSNRRSVLDVYYNKENSFISTQSSDLPSLGFAAKAPVNANGSVESKNTVEPTERKAVSKKKRRMVSLIYILACAEEQR